MANSEEKVRLDFRSFMEADTRVYNQFSRNTAGAHNDMASATFLPSTWTGSEDLGPMSFGLPGTDLAIPHVTIKSRVRFVEKNRNPIRVQLMDGTTLYFTTDEFRRVQSRTSLEPDREVTVTFQRRDDDGSPDPSKVVSID